MRDPPVALDQAVNQHRDTETLQHDRQQRCQVGLLARPVVGRQDDRANPAVRALHDMHSLLGGGQEAEHFSKRFALDAQAEDDGTQLEVGHAAIEHRRVKLAGIIT